MSPRRTRYVLAKGYVVRYAPEHPLASDTGLVPEHRMVLYDVLGPGPHPCHWCGAPHNWSDLHADHLNFDRQDNRPANLVAACFACNSGRRERSSCGPKPREGYRPTGSAQRSSIGRDVRVHKGGSEEAPGS
jgi:hypothetical protein